MKIGRMLITAIVALLFAGAAYAAGPVVKLCVKPGHMDLRPGVQQQFSVFGLDIFDNEVPVTEPLTWTTPTNAGTITSDGLFTAGSVAGRYMKGIKVTTPSGLSGVALITISVVAPAGGYYFERAWGNFIPGQTLIPEKIKMGPNGSVLVPDHGTYTVHQFDTSGRYVFQYGPLWNDLCSTDSTTFFGEYVYAAPDGHLVKFDANGNVVWQLNGDSSAADGQFGRVSDIATDSSGNLYIIDLWQHRVEKFSPTGAWMAKWGSEGTGNGQFLEPQSICVDTSGNVYVADLVSNCVQKFSSAGTFLAKWTDYGSTYGPMSKPGSLTADAKGNIYVYNPNISRIYTMTTSGVVTKVTDIAGAAYITVDADGNIYASSGNSWDIWLKKFDASGNLVAEWGRRRAGQLTYPTSIAATKDGTVYVARGSNISSFDSAGNSLGQWSHWGMSVRVDSAGNVYYPTGFSGVDVCSPSGEQIKHYDLPKIPGRDVYSDCVAVASNGDVYIGDTRNNQITRLDASGNMLAQWGSTGTGKGQFQMLGSLAVDSAGYVYALDQNTDKVQRFSSEGNWVSEVAFGNLMGFTVSPNDAIFTAEYRGPIKKFSTSWSLLGTWGAGGYGAAQFYPANDVAVDAEDNVYIADGLNNRIQKFAPILQVSSKVKDLKDGSFITLAGQIVTANALDFGDCIYVEQPDRSSGIRVTGVTSVRGYNVSITGTLTTTNGERTIKATSLTASSFAPVTPLALTNKALGGADLNYDPKTGKGQRGVEDGEGANNIGLLVKTSGKVTGVGSDFFYIDDGTHSHDGSIFVGVRVQCRKLVKPKIGANVTVTGVSRINKIGDRYFRSLSARIQSDIAAAQ